MHCTEKTKQIFSEMKLWSLFPNFCIYVSLGDFYIYMNEEIGSKAAQFHFWKYLFKTNGTVWIMNWLAKSFHAWICACPTHWNRELHCISMFLYYLAFMLEPFKISTNVSLKKFCVENCLSLLFEFFTLNFVYLIYISKTKSQRANASHVN